MFLCAVVFILSGFLHLGASSTFEELTEKLQDIKSEIELIEDENKKLAVELKNVDNTMEMDIHKMAVHEEIFTEGLSTEMTNLIKLRKELSDKYAAETYILQEIEEEQQLNSEYELEKSLLKGELKLLEEREVNGEAEKCKILEMNVTDDINVRQLPSNRTEETEEDITLLQLAISQSSNVLKYTRELGGELKQELQDKLSLNERIKQSFEYKLIDASNDVIMARNASISFKNKMDFISTEIQNLERKLLSLIRLNKNVIKEIKQLGDNLKRYEEDLACYRKNSKRVSNIDSFCEKTSYISQILC